MSEETISGDVRAFVDVGAEDDYFVELNIVSDEGERSLITTAGDPGRYRLVRSEE